MAIAVFCLLFLRLPASAEVLPREQIITLDPAAAIPLSMQGPASLSAAGVGVSGSLQDIFALTRHWGVGLELGYAKFGRTSPSSVVSSSMTMFTAEVVGRYVFSPQAPYNPYILLGAGINNLSLSSSNSNSTLNQSHGKPTFSLGAGLERTFADSWVAGLEARWRYIGTYDWTSKAGSFSTTNSGELLLGARFGYRFGGGW